MDFAHKATDELLDGLEKELAEAFADAAKEVQEKLLDYLRRFEIKDEKWQLWVAQGKKTEEQYKAWRTQQLIVGDRWSAVRDNLSRDLVHADQIAQRMINGEMVDVYALNANWATYQIEKSLGISTNFTLVSRDTVAQLVKKNPKLLPFSKGIDIPVDMRWNMRRVQSAMLQGILQGESIPHIAERVAAVTDGNIANATRNARTMTTCAENSGRQMAYERAVEHGVKMRKTWLATLDMRTRHEHRVLDGQTVDIDEPFVVDKMEIMFPGDPIAEPFLVYNCRCRTIAQVQGYERDIRGFDLRADPDVKGMSYDEWKESRKEITRPITYQRDVGKAIRGSYYAEYARDDE